MVQFETTLTRIADLRRGDYVKQHGGIFCVLEDAHPSMSHAPQAWVKYEGYVQLDGPVDCAYCKAVCVDGEIEGYFAPGSDWSFQGSTEVKVHKVIE